MVPFSNKSYLISPPGDFPTTCRRPAVPTTASIAFILQSGRHEHEAKQKMRRNDVRRGVGSTERP